MADKPSILQRTILLVEDDTSWHKILTRLLRAEDFNIVNAFDYSDALNKLQHLYPVPELAIVDLNLPSSLPQHVYDGLHVLTALRARGIYAIILSGFLREVAESVAQRPEVYDVVDKLRFTDENFIEHFLAKVHAAMAHAAAARQAEGKLLVQQDRLRCLLLPS
jgi:DNA-binding response OmpR family regulator